MKELSVFGIKNCNTMKKTFDFLNENNIPYQFIDYKKQAPDVALLEKFLEKVSLESLINKKGTTYKKISEEDKQKMESESSALNMLSSNSSMIKRPIIEFPNGDLALAFEPEKIISKVV
jgi:Spx/MgsR family transcriptional regulator